MLIAPAATSVDFVEMHARHRDRYPVLLESVARSPATGRHDILFACPGERLELTAHGLQLNGRPAQGSFLSALREAWRRERCPSGPPAKSPFCGGWTLFLAYELAGEVEPSLGLPAPADLPIATAQRMHAALVRDHADGSVHAVAEPGYAAVLEEILDDARALQPVPTSSVRFETTEPPAEAYLHAVRLAQREIAAGNVYQVNLSREWRAQASDPIDATALYRRLRRSNPAPFAGIMAVGGTSILSSSPERLIAVCGSRVSTRPIAGTRPRTASQAAGEVERQALLANAKERAEHVMLIDLERNDLGRICRPGTVQVDEFMTLESYAHVHHLVSNVTGELAPDVGPAEIIRAVFPGGTITGCPKVRALEVIRNLEQRARGAYTGSMGYLSRDGQLDLNILIRTMTICEDSIAFAAGSGIVADSDPERELEESRAKAKGMLLALGSA